MPYDSKRCSFPPGPPKPPANRPPPEPPPGPVLLRPVRRSPCAPAPTRPSLSDPERTAGGLSAVGRIRFLRGMPAGRRLHPGRRTAAAPIPGIYRAEYILTFPALKTLNTVSACRWTAGTSPALSCGYGNRRKLGSMTVSAQVIFEAACPSTLRVSSSSCAFRLDSPGPNDTMASLTIFRL